MYNLENRLILKLNKCALKFNENVNSHTRALERALAHLSSIQLLTRFVSMTTWQPQLDGGDIRLKLMQQTKNLNDTKSNIYIYGVELNWMGIRSGHETKWNWILFDGISLQNFLHYGVGPINGTLGHLNRRTAHCTCCNSCKTVTPFIFGAGASFQILFNWFLMDFFPCGWPWLFRYLECGQLDTSSNSNQLKCL